MLRLAAPQLGEQPASCLPTTGHAVTQLSWALPVMGRHQPAAGYAVTCSPQFGELPASGLPTTFLRSCSARPFDNFSGSVAVVFYLIVLAIVCGLVLRPLLPVSARSSSCVRRIMWRLSPWIARIACATGPGRRRVPVHRVGCAAAADGARLCRRRRWGTLPPPLPPPPPPTPGGASAADWARQHRRRRRGPARRASCPAAADGAWQCCRRRCTAIADGAWP